MWEFILTEAHMHHHTRLGQLTLASSCNDLFHMLLHTKYNARKHIWNMWKKFFFFFKYVAAQITTSFIFYCLCNPHRDWPPAVTSSNYFFLWECWSKDWFKMLMVPSKKTNWWRVYFFLYLNVCSCIFVLTDMVCKNVLHWQCLLFGELLQIVTWNLWVFLFCVK